jgi:hypothetical protein
MEGLLCSLMLLNDVAERRLCTQRSLHTSQMQVMICQWQMVVEVMGQGDCITTETKAFATKRLEESSHRDSSTPASPLHPPEA